MPGRRELVLDVVAIVVFVVLGRRSHGESGTLHGIVVVAAPFLAGWLVGALLVRLDRAPTSTMRALRALVIALPLAFVLRSLSGRGLAPGFVAVAIAFLGLTLVGRRALAAYVAARRPLGPAG